MLAGELLSRRFAVTSVLAAGAHLLVLAFVATRPAPRVVAPSPPAVDDAPIAIDLDPERPAPLPREPVPAPARVAAIEARAPAGPVAPRRGLVTVPVAAATAEGDAVAAGASGGVLSSLPIQATPPALVASATAVPDGLPPPLLPRAIRAPSAVLDAPLAVRQAEAGTGASGQVMATVQKAAERSGPKQGHGVIRITVEEDGTVSGVTVSGVGWDGAARGIRAALAGRRLHLPKGAHGLVLSFAADAVFTRTPPVLTGEARAESMLKGIAPGTAPPIYDSNRGMGIGAPDAAVINPLALLPLPRRVVRMELLSEQLR